MYSVQLTTKWERTLVPVDGTQFLVGKWVKTQVPIVFDEPEPAPEPEPETAPETAPESEPEPEPQVVVKVDEQPHQHQDQQRQADTDIAMADVTALSSNISSTHAQQPQQGVDAMDTDAPQSSPAQPSPGTLVQQEHVPGTDGMLAASHDPKDRLTPQPKSPAASPLRVSTSKPVSPSRAASSSGSPTRPAQAASPTRASRAQSHSPSAPSAGGQQQEQQPITASTPSSTLAPSPVTSIPAAGRSPNLPMPPSQQRHLHHATMTHPAGLPPAPSSRPHSPAVGSPGNAANAAGLPPKPAIRPPPPPSAGLPRKPSSASGDY